MLLSGEAQNIVVDQTNLPGKYDFTLDWSRAQEDPDGNANAPQIFTAAKEQLGRQIVSQKIPETVLYIDSIEHPIPN